MPITGLGQKISYMYIYFLTDNYHIALHLLYSLVYRHPSVFSVLRQHPNDEITKNSLVIESEFVNCASSSVLAPPPDSHHKKIRHYGTFTICI